jgi:hypothetical protein
MILAISEATYERFAHQHGRALNADATQPGKLLDHLTSFIGRFRFHYRVTLALQLSDLREYQFQPSKQTLACAFAGSGSPRAVRSSVRRRLRFRSKGL